MSWHAAAVHIPIALALTWPVVDLVGLVARRPAVSWTAVGLLGAAALSSLVATATGQAEYDAAYAAGHGVELLDSHAGWASTVPWALLGLVALRLYLPTRVGRVGHVAALGLGFLSWALVLEVGRTGGALVYRHGVGVTAAPVAAPR